MNRRFPPTPRKLKKAREEGDVAKASEVTAVCVCISGIGGFGAALLLMQQILESAHNFVNYGNSLHLRPGDFQTGNFQPDEIGMGLIALEVVLLCVILIGMFFVSAAVEMLQIGWTLNFGLVAVKGERLNIALGLRRLFGIQSEPFSIFRTPLWELTKIIMLWSAISVPCLSIAEILRGSFAATADLQSLLLLAACPIAAVSLSLLTLSLTFFLIARLERTKRLSMDLEELKRELRDSEGREETKRRRHELFEELGRTTGVRRAKMIVTRGGES